MAKILIIDDDSTVQMLLTRALSKNGYDIVLAKDGLEGLTIAKKIKPALIISDWLMPKLSGFLSVRARSFVWVLRPSSMGTSFVINND